MLKIYTYIKMQLILKGYYNFFLYIRILPLVFECMQYVAKYMHFQKIDQTFVSAPLSIQ